MQVARQVNNEIAFFSSSSCSSSAQQPQSGTRIKINKTNTATHLSPWVAGGWLVGGSVDGAAME